MSEWDQTNAIRMKLLEGLRQGVEYDVPLRGRRELWLSFGDYQKSSEIPFALPGPGMRRRFDLQLGCVLRALPLWEEFYPRSMIVDIITLGIHYLLGKATVHDLRDTAVSAYTDFDDFEDPPPAAMLGFAAVNLLQTLEYDSFVHPDIVNEQKDDLQYNFDNHEVSFVVSRVLVGTIVPSNDMEVKAIRDFWEWYLVEAVPKSWELGFQSVFHQ